jgi:hypothetical protein
MALQNLNNFFSHMLVDFTWKDGSLDQYVYAFDKRHSKKAEIKLFLV